MEPARQLPETFVSPATEIPTRRPELDAAKGIAIVLVVVFHVWSALVAAGRAEPTALRAWLDAFAYTFHTQVFFFVAGMVFPDPSRPGFFGKVGRRLVYPYVLWGTVQGFIVAFAGSAANFPIAPRDVLPSLIFEPGHQFWFLYVLIAVTLLTGLALRMGWERRDVLIASIVLFVLQMLAPGPPAIRWTGFHAVYFAAGLCVGLERPLPPPWVVPAAYGALAIVVTFGWQDSIVLRPLWATIGIAGTLALAQAWPNRALCELGRASLAIYVAHVMAAVPSRVLPFPLASGIALGLGLPYVLWLIAERTGLPLFRWRSATDRQL